MAYRLLDLFSGIGGFSLGLERSGGFKTVAFCEIEPFCRRVLAKHWPGVPIYDDVRKITADTSGERRGQGWARGTVADGQNGIPAGGPVSVGPIDAICGGFPCQDISTAGKGAGLDGERSGLWREYARIVGELRPRYVIVENVAALLGRGLDRVLGDLAALGYDAEWHCIPASAVGAPHRRDRLWIVANPQRDQQPWGEPRLRTLGRMGRLKQPVPWDRDWQAALATLRGMDDGLSRSVDRTDGLRNAVVPQIPELIGRAIVAADRKMEAA